MKFKEGIPFTLRELFNENGMANLDEGLSKIILQNVTNGEKWRMIPNVNDNSNVNNEFRVSINPLMEDSFIAYLNGILKFESSVDGAVELQPFRNILKEILSESDYEEKVRSFLAFTLEHPSAYNNSIE
jgi:hypothetical protein